MCGLVQVLLKYVQGVLARAVASLLDKPLQGALHGVAENGLLLLNGVYLCALPLVAFKRLVNRDDSANNDAERPKKFGGVDDVCLFCTTWL